MITTLTLLLAAAAASPSPSPASGGLRTIATVRATPFCTSLAQHFNGAVSPMLDNDRTLDKVDGGLVDLNDVFHHPDYQIRYAGLRAQLMKQVSDIQRNLPFMQQQINLLRQGENLTKDPQEAKQTHAIAEKLQQAYNKQYQLATDLTGVVQTLMSYQPPEDLDVATEELQEQSIPKDMRDVKSYLRFDGQRDVIDRAENAAADAAIELAVSRCTVQK